MALPISGKTYVFICDGARSEDKPKALNLYYSWKYCKRPERMFVDPRRQSGAAVEI